MPGMVGHFPQSMQDANMHFGQMHTAVIDSNGPSQQQQNSMGGHQHFQKTSASSYHPPISVKHASVQQQQTLGGTIHAPRHSQTKRSFGRDLINI